MSESAFSLATHYRKADKIMLGVAWLMFIYSLGGGLDWKLVASAARGRRNAGRVARFDSRPAPDALLCRHGFHDLFGTADQSIRGGGHGRDALRYFRARCAALLSRLLPIVAAAAFIAGHHLLFFALQEQGVEVHIAHHGGWPIIFLHAFYVVLESTTLVYLAMQAHGEAREAQGLLQAVGHMANEDGIGLRFRSESDGPVTHRFNRFVDRLDQLVGVVLQDTSGLNDMRRHLASATRQLREGARRQLQETAYMANAMSQMSTASMRWRSMRITRRTRRAN